MHGHSRRETCVHGGLWQPRELTVLCALVLHEDKIPNLEPRILAASRVLVLLPKYLRARPAWTCTTHRPEVFFFIARQDLRRSDSSRYLRTWTRETGVRDRLIQHATDIFGTVTTQKQASKQLPMDPHTHLFPKVSCLIIPVQIGEHQPFGRQIQGLGEELPREDYGLFFKIV